MDLVYEVFVFLLLQLNFYNDNLKDVILGYTVFLEFKRSTNKKETFKLNNLVFQFDIEEVKHIVLSLFACLLIVLKTS